MSLKIVPSTCHLLPLLILYMSTIPFSLHNETKPNSVPSRHHFHRMRQIRLMSSHIVKTKQTFCERIFFHKRAKKAMCPNSKSVEEWKYLIILMPSKTTFWDREEKGKTQSLSLLYTHKHTHSHTKRTCLRFFRYLFSLFYQASN